jgi:hypothetical protein
MEATHYLSHADIEPYQLADLQIFSDISAEHLRQFLSICKVFSYHPEEKIITQGVLKPWVFILLSGKIRVLVNGVEITVIHQRSDVFGESPLISKHAPTATVEALTDVRCLAIDIVLLSEIHTKGNEMFNAAFYRYTTRLLVHRLARMSEELALVKSVFNASAKLGKTIGNA